MADREERKTEIIQAAVKVFSRKGLDKAKMEEIAREAGIGKGTIYEYFESKKSLFQEMARFSVQQYCNDLKKIVFKNESFREKLINYIKYQVKFLNENIDMMNMAIESNILSKDMRCWFLQERKVIFSLLKDMVEEGIKKGELREELDKEMAVLCIVGSINQYSTCSVFFGSSGSGDVQYNAFVDIILKGLVNRE